MNPMFLVVLILVVVAATYGAQYLSIKKRKEEARRVASARGYQVDVEKRSVPFHGFGLLDNGDTQHISMRFSKPGTHDTVFQFTYKVQSSDSDGGSRTKTYHHTCAMVTLPFHAPPTTIGREGLFSKLARAVGRRDIEVESDRFNKRFRVKGRDERFAVTLLDGETINWFLREHGFAASADYEMIGGQMLVEVTGKLDPGMMLDYLEWATTIPKHFPTVLQTLYNKTS